MSSHHEFPIPVRPLLDTGSHLNLIRSETVERYGLKLHKLRNPEMFGVAAKAITCQADYYVKFVLHCPISGYVTNKIHCVVFDKLTSPLILGVPFLAHNGLVVDAEAHTVIQKDTGIDILHPVPPSPVGPAWSSIFRREHPKNLSPKDKCLEICADHIALRNQLKVKVLDYYVKAHVGNIDIVASIRERVEVLADEERRRSRESKIIAEFPDVFGDIPHMSELPTDITCKITLKDASRMVQSRSYPSPRKYCEAWDVLIKKHLDAGRIRPSNLQFSSPAFLVPKSDPSALPRWVNDYRQLNSNIVSDRHPLPRIEDIIADAARGKIWGKMDMTDSFFQTPCDPETVPYMAVNTPLGLYEWLVMPQGLKISPAVQQRRVTAALREFIGKFCHIYLDDIIIWSNSEEEHEEHVRLISETLRKNKLYCNPKKCSFFLDKVDFLGYHISRDGVEAQSSKVDAVLNFPRPHNAEEMRRFLGMVRFIAGFLQNLAEHTRILNPFTSKDFNKGFPEWTLDHECAFVSIKKLVTDRSTLVSIDHNNPGENKIFLTTDASDWRSGAVLSWGTTLSSARPVAFDSQPFTGPELNYPVHEKELLAIVRALRKWRLDCIGMHVHVLTDHRTLENFNTQRELSRRQLRWQEFMSQYKLMIAYLEGEKNLGADALSRVQNSDYSHEVSPLVTSWNGVASPVSSILSVSTDISFLADIRKGYLEDSWCRHLSGLASLPDGISCNDGLWYLNGCLIIPRYGSLREDLFRVAHNALGHWGFNKSYDNLRDSYYWPSMRKDLERAYVPGCDSCQKNKDSTRRARGPLHPLPVADSRCSAVAIDFVGPLPEDDGFNALASMTCMLGSDLRVAPTRNDYTVKQFALVFLNTWYCENGLPLFIILDQDHLFVAKLWKAIHVLTGVKIKMSSAYHPKTDGSSERSNKTVVQALRYFVDHKQKGWVKALPLVTFNIRNSLNASSGFSMFKLKTEHCPRVMPPLEPPAGLPSTLTESEA